MKSACNQNKVWQSFVIAFFVALGLTGWSGCQPAADQVNESEQSVESSQPADAAGAEEDGEDKRLEIDVPGVDIEVEKSDGEGSVEVDVNPNGQ
jgi:hypothetical protein